MTHRYPSKAEIEELCSHLGTSDPSPFFDRVAPDVVWDVMGMFSWGKHAEPKAGVKLR